MASAYLLMYSALTKRGKEFKWVWFVYLITGLAMIFTTSLWLVDVQEIIADAKMIGFGIIAPFIAGVLAIVACIYEKIRR